MFVPNRRTLFVAGLILAAAAAKSRAANTSSLQLIRGGARKFAGGEVVSWAKLDANRNVSAVGITVPMGVIENPPAKKGTGPAGAIAVLRFPDVVRETSYFDHFELQWNPNGHMPHCFMKAHFDFHFYSVPEATVRSIKTFDGAQPAEGALPKGYIYPAEATFEPEMGVHAGLPEILKDPFTAVMIAGYNKGYMHFVEPMVTQEFLKRRQSFTLEVPRPDTLGRATRYPTKFEATYDASAKAYRFTFSDFVTYTQAGLAVETASTK